MPDEWTVETLARYLWERAKDEPCEGCEVRDRCEQVIAGSARMFDCVDQRAVLEAFGLKEDDDAAI